MFQKLNDRNKYLIDRKIKIVDIQEIRRLKSFCVKNFSFEMDEFYNGFL